MRVRLSGDVYLLTIVCLFPSAVTHCVHVYMCVCVWLCAAVYLLPLVRFHEEAGQQPGGVYTQVGQRLSLCDCVCELQVAPGLRLVHGDGILGGPDLWVVTHTHTHTHTRTHTHTQICACLSQCRVKQSYVCGECGQVTFSLTLMSFLCTVFPSAIGRSWQDSGALS